MTIGNIILLFAVCIMVGCYHGDVIESNVVQESSSQLASYESLQSIRCFAFGGVGYAGVMSEGEAAFRSLVSKTNAFEMFSQIITNGTTEAKLYALCGIRELDPVAFEKEAGRIDANLDVRTMSGCIGSIQPARDVIGQIRSGAYDEDIQGKGRRNLSRKD